MRSRPSASTRPLVIVVLPVPLSPPMARRIGPPPPPPPPPPPSSPPPEAGPPPLAWSSLMSGSSLSAADLLALADDDDPVVGHREPFAVGLGVHPDRHSRRHRHV